MFLHVRLKAPAVVLATTLFFTSFVPAFAGEDRHEGWRDDDDHEKVVLTFSTVGDSRQDPKSPDPTTIPVSGQDQTWLQNTKAWTRIMRSIQHQRSDFLFFNGDMIMGYGNAALPQSVASVDDIVGSDLMQFYRQYGFWRGLVANLMETRTYVVPVPGNHETQCSDKVSKQCPVSGKHAVQNNEVAWRKNMGDLILDDSRFQSIFEDKPTYEDTADNKSYDSLATDQSQLSYSFDFRGVHFAVINTDPVGKDAHAPVQWLKHDFELAKGRGAKHFFVFGHKPAFTYYYALLPTVLPSSPSGLDGDTTARDAFWDLIEEYDAVYFCGHEHIFNLSQPRKSKGGKAWQVLVGSGGSPFDVAPADSTLNPATDRDYAWATVKVYENGTVRITAYGFDDKYGPTRVIGSIKLK
jgi:hypothetical protein